VSPLTLCSEAANIFFSEINKIIFPLPNEILLKDILLVGFATSELKGLSRYTQANIPNFNYYLLIKTAAADRN
jgi:hypothetical protein